MLGTGHFYNFVKLTYGYAGSGRSGWSAYVTFQDAGFCSGFTAGEDISTEGSLRTRYYVCDSDTNGSGVRAAIEAILKDLDALGVKAQSHNVPVLLFVSNREDIERGKDAVPVEDIPGEDLKEISVIAKELGFDVAGFEVLEGTV